MRLAVLASSPYAACQKLPELPSAGLDLELLGQRLSEPDAGYKVVAFRAERGLAEAVEQVLGEAEEPIEALLFFFSGYAVLSDERGPALLLDGERLGTFSCKRLKRLVSERAQRALLVLDTVTAFDTEESPGDAAQALADALAEPGFNAHLLLSNRLPSSGEERSAFTSLLELVLDWQSTRSSALGVEELFAAMRAEESLFAMLPAAKHVPGGAPFDVLLGNGSVVPPSMPPSEAPPSEEPQLRAERVSADEQRLALEASNAAEARGDYPAALASLRIVLRGDAHDKKALGRMLVLSELSDRPETRWNAACALELLGAANETELELAAEHRPSGLLPAQGVLAEADWLANLLCPERRSGDEALVRSLGDAVVRLGVETARRKRRMPPLNAATEQDPEKSTTMLARTLVWTARLLGLPRPRLHVLDDASHDLFVAPLAEPTVVASKSLGSGLTLPELAFRWARRLVFLRPELRLPALFAAPGELEALARASVSLITAGTAPRLDGDAKLFARSLKRHLTAPSIANLSSAVGSSSTAGVAARLKAWGRDADYLAGRAGLLATGDLRLAASLIERFPLASSSAAEQIDDLVQYSLSEEYETLRARLGVAVR